MYKTFYAFLLLNMAGLPAVYAQQMPPAQQRTNATWAAAASMTDKRAEHMAAAIGGRIYVWGGYTGPVYPYELQVNSLETYDVGANTWTRTPASAVVGRDLPSAVGPNGLVYVIGTAAGGAGRNLRFEPATNTVTTLQAPAANHFAGAAAAGLDGKIYVFGGYAATTTSIYNPTTNTWTTGAPVPGGRHSHVAVRDAAGLIHLIGGGVASPSSYYLDGAATNVHLVYNPVTNSWTTRAPLPALLFEAAATLGADGNIYFIGGSTEKYFNSGNFVSSVYIYNPTTDAWTSGPDLPAAASEAQAVTSGNRIYVVGGNWPFTCMTCNGERQTTRVLQLAPVGTAWTGSASTDWNAAANWSGGAVPTATDDVIIPAGLARYPSPAAVTCRNLTIERGASLTMADGSTLTVGGHFLNEGTFTASGNATLVLNGPALQTIASTSPLQLRNLTVGAAGARLSSALEVQRLLTLTGNLDTNQQRFLLRSDQAGTAMVVNNGGAVIGRTTVQRYIDPAGNPGFGYRHWAPAVGGSALGQLTTRPSLPGAPAPGPLQLNAAYNSAANPGSVTPFPTLFAYDQARVTAAGTGVAGFDQGWLSPADTAYALLPGQGLTVNQAAGNAFELTGPTLTTGPVTRGGLTRGTGSAAGWHLVGNPYPAPIDWGLVGRTNVDGAAYVYRSSGPYVGGYTAYVNGIGGSGILPAGQAFFVHVSAAGATGSVAFTDAARLTTYTDAAYSRPTAETRPLLQLTLQGPGAAGAANQDALYIYQQAGATAGFDSGFDALKVQLNGGQQPSLYQQAGAAALAIQGLALGNQPQTLALGLNAPAAGAYAFLPEQLLNFPAAAQLVLEDKLTGAWHDLRQGAYTVQLPQGVSTTRFVLHLNAARPLATKGAWAGEVQVYPNPVTGRELAVVGTGLRGNAEVRLLNALGQVVRAETVSAVGNELRLQWTLGPLPAGMYTVQVRSAAGTVVRQLSVL